MPQDEQPDTTTEPNRVLTGSMHRTIFWLALPVLTEQCLSFCVGFFDTWLSGHLGADSESVSASATSAVGVAAYAGWLASLLYGLVGVGTTALVSRHWGAGERADANRVMNCSLMLAVVFGLGIALLIYAVAPFVAEDLRTPGNTQDVVLRFLRIECFGYFLMGPTLVGAAALRGAGDMRTPMFVLGLVSIVNVAVSIALTFGMGPIPSLGVDGIVAGTVTAHFIGTVLLMSCLVRGVSGLKISSRWLSWHTETIRRVLRIGVPAALDGIFGWVGHYLYLRIIADLATGDGKTIVFAAHIVGVQMEAVTYLPAIAWGYAASTIIGQSLGARKPNRALQSGRAATLQCCIPGLLATLAFLFGADQIYELMHENTAVAQAGAPALRMISLAQVPLVVLIVFIYSLRGAGESTAPMCITFFGVYLVRLPVAYLFGIVWEGGLVGAWVGMCADVILRAILAIVLYQRGKWLQKTV